MTDNSFLDPGLDIDNVDLNPEVGIIDILFVFSLRISVGILSVLPWARISELAFCLFICYYLWKSSYYWNLEWIQRIQLHYFLTNEVTISPPPSISNLTVSSFPGFFDWSSDSPIVNVIGFGLMLISNSYAFISLISLLKRTSSGISLSFISINYKKPFYS